MILIPKPAGVHAAFPRDVSNDGVVVGEATRCATYPTNCYEWGFIYDMSSGVWTDIQPLNPPDCGALVCGESAVRAINESGQCCGWRTIGTPGGTQLFPTTGFIYDIASDTITDIGFLYGESTGCADINDKGTFTGSVRVENIWHSYIYQNGRATDLGSLNEWGSAASLAISGDDAIVGGSVVETLKYPLENPHAFLWSSGRMVNLGALPGDNQSIAQKISDNGVIVGFSRYLTPKTQVDHAVVWHQETIYSLGDLVESPLIATIVFANAISTEGSIVASARTPVGDQLAVVLNPAPWALADIDRDCAVNIHDLLFVIFEWGRSDSRADLNNDGNVNHIDLFIVITNWT